jgi:hypothetical protein
MSYSRIAIPTRRLRLGIVIKKMSFFSHDDTTPPSTPRGELTTPWAPERNRDKRSIVNRMMSYPINIVNGMKKFLDRDSAARFEAKNVRSLPYEKELAAKIDIIVNSRFKTDELLKELNVRRVISALEESIEGIYRVIKSNDDITDPRRLSNTQYGVITLDMQKLIDFLKMKINLFV